MHGARRGAILVAMSITTRATVAKTLFVGLVLVGSAAGQALGQEIVADWVFDGLQEARAEAGAPALTRGEVLDEVAASRARRIAGLPHSERLAYQEPLESTLMEAGVRQYRRLATHMDMARGYSNPTAAFLRNWRRYEQSWKTALDPEYDSVGVGIHAADDGWVIFYAVFVEGIEEPDEPAELERQTAAAINEVRREHGLSALESLEVLAGIAREHSADMARRDYFAHDTPDGRSPEDRIVSHGLRFQRFSENIQMSRGLEDPVRVAVESWMESPGHREAILTPEYRQTGVGVAVSEDGTIYFTQLFFTPKDGLTPIPPPVDDR